LVLPHLVVAAIVAGSAALLLASLAWPGTLLVRDGAPHPAVRVDDVLVPLLFLATVAHGALILCEVLSRHPNPEAVPAARLLRRGAYGARFWGGVVIGGTLAPLAALSAAVMADSTALTVVGALLALAGLWLWEDLWVKAGQSVPLS